MQKLKDMLEGFKFSFRLEGVRVSIFTPEFKIVKEHKILPNMEFDLALFGIYLTIVEGNVVVKIMLREMKLVDYFAREAHRARD